MSDKLNVPSETRRPLLSGGEKLREVPKKVGHPPGTKYHPYDHNESFQLLSPQAATMREALHALPRGAVSKHIVFEARLLPNYLAKSYHPVEILHEYDLYPVGARGAQGTLRTKARVVEGSETKILLLAGTPSSLDAFSAGVLAGPLAAPESRWDCLQRFDELTLPPAKRIIRSIPADAVEDEFITWEAVLSMIGRNEKERLRWNDEVIEQWTAWVEKAEGIVYHDYVRTVGTLTFVPIKARKDAIRTVAGFNLLRSVRPMPQIRPLPDGLLRRTRPTLLPPPPDSGAKPTSPGRIAIFDGGFDARLPHVSQFSTLTHVTPEPFDAACLQHGTLVTSAALYGHIPGGLVPLPTPAAGVDHYRVLPVPRKEAADVGAYWILDRIRETVARTRPGIVNLSIGPAISVEDGFEPDRWTSELDALAHEYGTLFVVAAGNNGEDDRSLGLHRVQVPSDMANGVGVGACDSRAIGSACKRAPYSAWGPGRFGQLVQPTGVAFGGSDLEPFSGFGSGGALSVSAGTSFAAPTAARGFALLGAGLNSELRTLPVMRAIGVHFSGRKSRAHPVLELGHGRLSDTYENIWECAASDCSVIYRDTLDYGETAAMYLPFPDGLPPHEMVELEWTVSYVSDINPASGPDYTTLGLDLTFRPNEDDRVLYLDDGKGKPKKVEDIDLRRDADRIATLMARDPRYSCSSVPKSISTWKRYRNESELRKDGKWETVVCGSHKRVAGNLRSPFIELKYLHRNAVAGSTTHPPLRFAMVVSMRAQKGVALYDRVRQEYRMLAPLVRLSAPVSV